MSNTDQHRITIRFTPEEYALVRSKAVGQPLAAFIREMVLKEAVTKRKATRRALLKDHIALAQVLAKLGTSPLVESFRGAVTDMRNGTIPVSEAADRSLERIATELAEIKSLLMSALGTSEQ
ncbi:MAG: hypothetical protein AAGD13_07535 [Pseudomonadota bacterium]